MISMSPNDVTRRLLLSAALVAGLGLGAGGCSLLGLEWRYRYRLTAVVETPQGVRSGSSVVEVTRGKGINGIGGRARGEAIAVDLPGGRTLFVLLRGNPGDIDWPFTMPHLAFEEQLGSRDMVNEKLLDKLQRLTGTRVVLERRYYPELIRFRDIRDPRTVELVDPDNLAASFGNGFRLLRIIVELTDDGVTHGIERRFSWWRDYHDRHFDGSTAEVEDMTTNNIAAHLSADSFAAFKQ